MARPRTAAKIQSIIGQAKDSAAKTTSTIPYINHLNISNSVSRIFYSGFFIQGVGVGGVGAPPQIKFCINAWSRK